MTAAFTSRQGEFLAFIHGFTGKYGYAPSFEEIGEHFGITPPSVNNMIKTLERRNLLSRLPGVARSLRVLVPASALPGTEFGSRRKRDRQPRPEAKVSPSGITAVESAGTAAIAVLDAVMPYLVNAGAGENGIRAVQKASQTVYSSLIRIGIPDSEAAEVARQIASEAARWDSEGRGTVISRWQWQRR